MPPFDVVTKREKFFEIAALVLFFLLISLIALSQDKVYQIVGEYKWHLLIIIGFVGLYFVSRKSEISRNDTIDISKKIKQRIYKSTGQVLNTVAHNVRIARLTQTEFIVEFHKEGLVYHWDDALQRIIGTDVIPMRSKLREMEKGLLREYFATAGKREKIEQTLKDYGLTPVEEK